VNHLAKLPLIAVAVIALLVAAEAQTDQVDKQELQKLQGTWVLVSGEVDGTPVAPRREQQDQLQRDHHGP
jgi:hypothetical protein